MTQPDPNTQPSGQPPPVHQPHPTEPQQQRPVIINSPAASDQDIRSLHAAVQNFGNQLAGLPEAMVNGIREATGLGQQPAQQQPPAQQPNQGGTQTQQTTQVAQNLPQQQNQPEGKRPNRFHSFWFGKQS